MKLMKSVALMMAGAGMVLAYQKYSGNVMDKLGDMADDIMKKASEKLEDMM